MSVPADERDPSKTCDTDGCNAWATKQSGLTQCRNHGGESTGPKSDEGKNTVRGNAVSHGLYSSEEVFLENASQHVVDTYHAVFEALCTRFEAAHGREPLAHDKKELSHVAVEMAKLDMALEYEAENAVDPEKPLTEMQEEMTESGPWESEQVSKIESLKTQIRRENRLLLKDKGIYNSPEAQKAGAIEASLSELLSEEH